MQARCRETQACFCLPGWDSPASDSPPAAVSKHGRPDFDVFADALGCGLGDTCDPARLRYEHIVVLVNRIGRGPRLVSQLLAALFAEMRPVIESGRVHVGLPPRFSAVGADGHRRFAFTREESESLLEGLPGDALVHHYYRIGDIEGEFLQETLLDRETRRTVTITPSDELASCAGVFTFPE
ncbi:MAG: hypothetical protein RL885_00620 [Planctomycetota bacterium]